MHTCCVALARRRMRQRRQGPRRGLTARQRWLVSKPNGSPPSPCPHASFTTTDKDVMDTVVDDLEWHGRGPHESTADRRASAFIGRYRGSVADQVTSYVRPQDSGSRADTRWAALRDQDGEGLVFAAPDSMAFNAQLHRPEDLADKRHWHEVPPSTSTVVRLDVAQEGIHGGTWDVPIRPRRFALLAEDGPSKPCGASSPRAQARTRQRGFADIPPTTSTTSPGHLSTT